MDSGLISLILFSIIKFSFAEEECDAKTFDSFFQCTENKFDKDLDRWKPSFVKTVFEDVEKCFTSNECEKPDYERDILLDLPPNMQILARKLKSDWHSTPADVKKCIFEKAKDRFKEEINECLGSHNVDPIDSVPENILERTRELLGGVNSDKAAQKFMETLFTAKVNIARGLRLCEENKGLDVMKKVWSCFQDVRQEHMFSQMCQDKLSCANETLTDACTKRGGDIENATCHCNGEEREKMLLQLQELKNQTLELNTVLNMMTKERNVSELVEKVQECYEKHKAPLPTILKFAEVIKKGKDKGDLPKMRLNVDTINTMTDIVNAVMDDEMCYVCRQEADNGVVKSEGTSEENSNSTVSVTEEIAISGNVTESTEGNSTTAE